MRRHDQDHLQRSCNVTDSVRSRRFLRIRRKGQGDRSESGGCSPSTEVRLTTQLTPATAVVFWRSVERLHHSHQIASVSFTLSNDEVVSLFRPGVTVTSKIYARGYTIPITSIRRYSRLNSPSCDPPEDSAVQRPDQLLQRLPDQAINSVFVIDIAVPDNPAEFTVQMSPVQVNGKMID